MLTLKFKNGKTEKLEVFLVKVDDIGISYIDPEFGMPTKIVHSRLKSFSITQTITDKIAAASVKFQKEFSSNGPRAKISHSES